MGVVYNHQAIADARRDRLHPVQIQPQWRRGGIWEKAYHFYSLHRDEFNAHYHKRSNVERPCG